MYVRPQVRDHRFCQISGRTARRGHAELGSPGLPQAASSTIKAYHRFTKTRRLFNAGLTQQDEKLEKHPYLAEARPQLSTDSWKVFPDGRMETTWRLRPNLTWHHGAPLLADDFVFSVQARMAWKTQGGAGRGGVALAALIDEVSSPDASTLVVRWKTLFTLAGESDWNPLPRHILGQAFADMSSPESIANLSYWNSEFVEMGPYRLEGWERGAFIQGAAFPGYVHGQPKIGCVQLVWLSDKNTAVAQLLAGAVDLAADGTIAFEQATVLKREWAAQGEPGRVLLSADTVRYVTVQFKKEYTNPAACWTCGCDRRSRMPSTSRRSWTAWLTASPPWPTQHSRPRPASFANWTKF